jgi:ABC-type transport system involved in multi-copper enzyme maturation permease subunit
MSVVEASPRPLPWRRMAGVTWRQHRIALAAVAVLLAAVAVWLWIAGTSVHHAYAAATACHPASSAACQDLASTFNGTWDLVANAAILLQLLPALIGAFAGAPVLARELETGTFRFAWTQGFGRWRWALAKLVVLAVVLAAATAAFGTGVSWCFQPYSAPGNQALGLYGNSPLVTVFSLREVTFPAWTLAAFAIGALAGMLIRRVVPAIVATLAVYTGLAITAVAFLREHYLAPLVTSNANLPGSAWIIGQWWTRDGRFAFAGNPPASLTSQFCTFPQSPSGKGSAPSSPVSTLAQCLAPHGYTNWTSYQPASRFWPFQWIEGGWLLTLSVLLIAATIWLVHRRAA